MNIKQMSSVIFSIQKEKELKKFLDKDYKYLDKVLFVLDDLIKKGIDIGITMNEEKKVIEAAIGKNGEFLSTLDDLFLKELGEISPGAKGFNVAQASGTSAMITDTFTDHGFRLAMSKGPDKNEMFLVAIDVRTNRKICVEAMIAGVSSLAYFDRKKKLSTV